MLLHTDKIHYIDIELSSTQCKQEIRHDRSSTRVLSLNSMNKGCKERHGGTRFKRNLDVLYPGMLLVICRRNISERLFHGSVSLEQLFKLLVTHFR